MMLALNDRARWHARSPGRSPRKRREAVLLQQMPAVQMVVSSSASVNRSHHETPSGDSWSAAKRRSGHPRVAQVVEQLQAVNTSIQAGIGRTTSAFASAAILSSLPAVSQGTEALPLRNRNKLTPSSGASSSRAVTVPQSLHCADGRGEGSIIQSAKKDSTAQITLWHYATSATSIPDQLGNLWRMRGAGSNGDSSPATVVPQSRPQRPRSERSCPVSARQNLETQPSRPSSAASARARHSSITWAGVRR